MLTRMRGTEKKSLPETFMQHRKLLNLENVYEQRRINKNLMRINKKKEHKNTYFSKANEETSPTAQITTMVTEISEPKSPKVFWDIAKKVSLNQDHCFMDL